MRSKIYDHTAYSSYIPQDFHLPKLMYSEATRSHEQVPVL